MDLRAFWQYSPEEVFAALQSRVTGLSAAEAAKRKALAARKKKERSPLLKDILLFLSQFKSPLTLLLVAAVILSAFLGERSDVFIILFILLFTGILSFVQERHAGKAVEKLKSIIRNRVKVLRDGNQAEVYTEDVVPGDILLFNAGDMIPADCLLLEENDLHTNESSLTGESYPAAKEPGAVPAGAVLSKRYNELFAGTSVVSGSAKALAVLTGTDTVFGEIGASLSRADDETAFEAGIRRFGYLLMKATFVLAIIILVGNLLIGRPLLNSLLFCLALAVGMVPELLPAIMTIAMSRGSKRMAEQKVIVRKLASIQNLGEIDLLCSDKTGTLSEGVIRVASLYDVRGQENETVKLYAWLNANFESGFINPMDEALRALKVNAEGYAKTDEVPYDFIRKRLSICVVKEGKAMIITKGALNNILKICSKVMLPEDAESPIEEYADLIRQQYAKYSAKGFRTIGICYKETGDKTDVGIDDENEMVFAGFILLEDPLKEGIGGVIDRLKAIGVQLKVITGDNVLVAAYIGEKVGLSAGRVLSGAEISAMSPEALVRRVGETDIFAEIEPQQKEHIIKALKKAGHHVGYMGDGINDVAAISAADVGISINNAVDVAKEAADIVLLEKDLGVLVNGIWEGRKTFLNTLKYIYTSTSAMFGNMFSVAGSSMLLPFLPMLPKQILLTNLMSDLPYMTIPSDRVDEAEQLRPRKWNMRQLSRFMIIFGLHSSIFDYITFFVLYRIFRTQELFHTGWFIESTITELLILYVVRTRHWLWKSRPGKLLMVASILVAIVTVGIPFSPLADKFGFVVPPWEMLGIILGILFTYLVTADILKVWFFKKY